MDDEKAERPWPVVRLVRRAGAAPESAERHAVDPPEEPAAPLRPGVARPGWNVRGTVRPGDRDGRAVAADRREEPPAEPPRQSRPPTEPPAQDGPAHDEWLRAWQRQEIGWLSGRVEELERLVRWRTWGLGGGLALSGLLNLVAIGFLLLSPGGSDAPVATVDMGPSADAPAGSPPSGGLIDTAPSAGPSSATPEAPQRPMAAPEVIPPEVILMPPDRQPQPAVPGDGKVSVGQTPDARSLAATSPPDAPAADPVGSAEDQALQGMLAAVAAADRAREAAAADGEGEAATGEGEAATGEGEAATEGSPEDGRYVANAVVYLRAAPAPDGEVVSVLAPGEEVRRIGADGDWLQVEFTDFADKRFTGYVPSLYLSPLEDTPQAE